MSGGACRVHVGLLLLCWYGRLRTHQSVSAPYALPLFSSKDYCEDNAGMSVRVTTDVTRLFVFRRATLALLCRLARQGAAPRAVYDSGENRRQPGYPLQRSRLYRRPK
jgi:hypothetical protein